VEQIQAAAAGQGALMQSYLQRTVHAQAAYLRRQAALVQPARRLQGHPEVPASEGDAALEAIDAAHS